MTAAVIALALAVLALGIGLIASLAWARGAIDARVKAEEEKLGTERKCLDLEDERDHQIGLVKKAEVERDEARKGAAVHEAAARAAREELTKHVREKLVTGSDGDVAAEVDRLLGVAVSKATALPNVPTPTAGDGGRPA